MLPPPCIFGLGAERSSRSAGWHWQRQQVDLRPQRPPARPARPSSSFSSCPPHFSFRAFSRPRGLCGAGTVSDGREGGSGPRFRFIHVATGFVRPSRALGNLRRQGRPRSADDEGPRDGEIRGRRPEISARPWPSLVDLGSPVVGLIYRLLCSLWHRP